MADRMSGCRKCTAPPSTLRSPPDTAASSSLTSAGLEHMAEYHGEDFTKVVDVVRGCEQEEVASGFG